MRWWWVALIVWIGCRDPGRGPAPVVTPTPAVVIDAAPPVTVGAFTQPPMPSRSQACNGVTCSGHGRCSPSGADDAVCRCDAGFQDYGLECVACTPVDTTYNIDLRVARFHGRITWNGRDLPKDLLGDVYLISEGDVGTRDEVELGRGRFDVGVLAGRYDIVLRGPGPHYYEPSTIVVAREVAIGGDTALDIALPLDRVVARITYAGALPAAGPDQGRLELVHGDTELWIDIARDPVTVYLPRVAFAIKYLPPRREEPTLPAVEAPLATGVTAERGELVLDVPIVTVAGTVRGLTAPFDPALSMIAFGDGAPVSLASPAFAAVLVRGRYDVWLTTKLRGRSLSVRLAAAVPITGQRLDLAMVPPTRLHGRFLLDSAARDAVIVAIGEGNVLGSIRIQLAPDGTFSETLPRGEYTLAVELAPGDSADVIALDRIKLVNELHWELDLPTHPVSATVTIDGVPAAPPTRGMGTLVLASITSPVSYAVWPAPGTLPAGTYRPRFSLGYPEPAGFPAISDLPSTPVEITGPTTLAFDLSTRRLSGSFTVDGKRSKSKATISLSGRSDGAHLGELATGSYKTVVVPGTYAVQYLDAFASADKHTPRNGRFNVGCITVK